MLAVLNPNINGKVFVSAQMVGGDFAVNLSAADEVYRYYRDNPNETITWGGYTGEASVYPPGGLQDDLWELDGFEPFNKQLEYYIQAILYGDQEAYGDLRDYVNTGMDGFLQRIAQDLLTLRDHIDDQDNPHETTKAHVGLGLVANYPFAEDLDTDPPMTTIAVLPVISTSSGRVI